MLSTLQQTSPCAGKDVYKSAFCFCTATELLVPRAFCKQVPSSLHCRTSPHTAQKTNKHGGAQCWSKSKAYMDSVHPREQKKKKEFVDKCTYRHLGMPALMLYYY